MIKRINKEMPDIINTAHSIRNKDKVLNKTLWRVGWNGVYEFVPVRIKDSVKRTSQAIYVVDKDDNIKVLNDLYLTKKEAALSFFRGIHRLADNNGINMDEMIKSYTELKNEVPEYFV